MTDTKKTEDKPNPIKERALKMKADAEQRLVLSSTDYKFNDKTGQIERTTEQVTVWQGVKNSVNGTVDDIKKAPLRKRALKAIADNALESIYAEIEAEQAARVAEKADAKATKVAAKEAAAKTKLETVVEKATATA